MQNEISKAAPQYDIITPLPRSICFIDRFGLKLIAILTMLCDHMWATVIPGNIWLTCIGRIAYPIFAFQVVEGFFHTRNLKTYFKRIILFALISEIPFNLMMGATVIYPYHQNVLFTFLIALFCMFVIEKVRKKKKFLFSLFIGFLMTLFGVLFATLAMTDYSGFGVLLVLSFYLARIWKDAGQWVGFHGRSIHDTLVKILSKTAWIVQFLGMYIVNCVLLAGQQLLFTVFGHTIEFPLQGIGMLSLIIIWLYNGKKGIGGKPMQYAVYIFYPLHILILSLIALYM